MQPVRACAPAHRLGCCRAAEWHMPIRLHACDRDCLRPHPLHNRTPAWPPPAPAAPLQVHAEVIERVTRGIEAYGLRCLGVTESPIKGEKSGNTEFLAHFVLEDPAKAAAAGLGQAMGADDDDGSGDDGRYDDVDAAQSSASAAG
jgi:hypothetical protein